MPGKTEFVKRRAPTLIAIITIKLVKGTIFLLLSLGFYALSDNDLNWEYAYLLRYLHVDGSRKLFLDLAARVAQIKDTTVLWVAGGTLAYGLLSLVQAIGLILRMNWAAIVTAAESGLLIPLEILELERHPSLTLFAVLVINVVILCYLLRNRNRLFRHHLH
jgi:uncharacterized membrane protein (DUF2068 family)